METMKDIICQVYAGQKQRKTIDLALNTFIPDYERLNLDYASKPGDEESIFTTEEEMINYFIEHSGLEQTFYWNQYENNPDKIMVGAIITEDDQLIISLTLDGNEVTQELYFEKLKKLLDSDIGVISYSDPAEYEDGRDFVRKYQS